jgi:hypothetical protein
VNTGFVPIVRRSRFVVAALALTALLDLAAIWADAREIRLVNRIIAGDFPSTDELDASDNRQTVVAVSQLFVLVATVVVFLIWFSRAYKNLAALGARDLRFSTGWAIGSWLVPILNLWRPKQITDDIWRASDPDAPPEQGSAWRSSVVPGFLMVWWIVWILSSWVGNAAGRAAFDSGTAQDTRDADYVDIASSVADIVAAALAVAVVLMLTRRQTSRATRLATMPPPLEVRADTF